MKFINDTQETIVVNSDGRKYEVGAGEEFSVSDTNHQLVEDIKSTKLKVVVGEDSLPDTSAPQSDPVNEQNTLVDVQNRAEEIIREAMDKAKVEGDKIIEAAKQEAEAIIETAKTEAVKIIDLAKEPAKDPTSENGNGSEGSAPNMEANGSTTDPGTDGNGSV